MKEEAGIPLAGTDSKVASSIKLEPKEANGAFDIGA